MPRVAIGPAAYVRLYGTGPRYGGGYPLTELRAWAQWLRAQAAAGRAAFAYFNNDVDAHAVADAHTLQRELQSA